MRRRTILAGGLGMGMVVAGVRPAAAAAPVVLELFTSQGCSSCPPADALLGVLVRQPHVIGLGWHVVYWNRLGWPDPFASRQWTDRQRAYARQLGTEVYTPAVVVNGSVMVVGSNQHAVAAAMRDAPALSVPITLRRSASQLEAHVGALPANAALSLVVYDPERVTAVGSGENGGRRLREFRIARELRALESASGRIMLPGIGDGQGAVLLARDVSGPVIGAAEVREV